MEDYKLRVIEEKKELDKKAKFLSGFIGNGVAFLKIHSDEQEMLRE